MLVSVHGSVSLLFGLWWLLLLESALNLHKLIWLNFYESPVYAAGHWRTPASPPPFYPLLTTPLCPPSVEHLMSFWHCTRRRQRCLIKVIASSCTRSRRENAPRSRRHVSVCVCLCVCLRVCVAPKAVGSQLALHGQRQRQQQRLRLNARCPLHRRPSTTIDAAVADIVTCSDPFPSPLSLPLCAVPLLWLFAVCVIAYF